MSRLSSLPSALQRRIAERRLLKVIAGLTNFDGASVERIARAAAAGGADLIDIACDPELVARVAAAAPGLPICVSAVDPELFHADAKSLEHEDSGWKGMFLCSVFLLDARRTTN